MVSSSFSEAGPRRPRPERPPDPVPVGQRRASIPIVVVDAIDDEEATQTTTTTVASVVNGTGGTERPILVG